MDTAINSSVPLENRAKKRGFGIIILILDIIAIIVISSFYLQWMHNFNPLYPSDPNIPIEFEDGNVIYTHDITFLQFNYTHTKIILLIKIRDETGETTIGIPNDFGNQSALSTGCFATFNQELVSSNWVDVNIVIVDSTGNGCFDFGDKIIFSIFPMPEDIIFVTGLSFRNETMNAGGLIEMSFVVHDGRLYAWRSHFFDIEDYY